MIVVRTEFQCKPGRAGEIVDRFKAMSDQLDAQDVIRRARIMTDLTGPFDTVVVESDVESIDAYYAMIHAAFADPAFQDAQFAADRPEQTGSRALYMLEAVFERGA